VQLIGRERILATQKRGVLNLSLPDASASPTRPTDRRPTCATHVGSVLRAGGIDRFGGQNQLGDGYFKLSGVKLAAVVQT